jgi:lambda family phage portal protein
VLFIAFLEKIFPRFYYERTAYRLARKNLEEFGADLRGYDAGNHSRYNREWNPTNANAEQSARRDRDVIRARARDMERNSVEMNALVEAFVRNMTGRSLEMQARSPDEKINERLENLWAEWCRPRNCDAGGRTSFQDMIKIAIRRKKIDGGILLIKTFSEGGLLPFKLQILEVDALDDAVLAPGTKGNILVDGVEITPRGAVAGYWIADGETLDPAGVFTRKSRFCAAGDVIFYCQKKRPGQYREISDFAHVLTKIRDMNEFLDAVAMRQRLLACIGLFFKKANPATGIPIGQGPTKSGGKGGGARRMEPGMVLEGNLGEAVDVIDPKGTSEDAAVFITMLSKQIAASAGLSYEAVSRDLSGSNYSSARQNMIEDEMTIAGELALLEDIVLREVYETFVISCVLQGLVVIPKFWENKRAYMAHSWIRGGKQWIDPLKEANANIRAMESGLKSYIQLCAEQGADWQNQLRDIAQAEKFANGLGLSLGVKKIGETD